MQDNRQIEFCLGTLFEQSCPSEMVEHAVRDLNDGEDEKNAFTIDELAIILDMKVDEIRDILRLTGDDN